MPTTTFNRPANEITQFGHGAFAPVPQEPEWDQRRHVAEQEFIARIRVAVPISDHPLKVGLAKALSGIVAFGCFELSPDSREQVAELSKLQKGWDGESAEAIKLHVLADAVEIVCRLMKAFPTFVEPFMVPTFDGYVQLEWHGPKRTLEIEVAPGCWNATGTFVGSSGEKTYFHSECRKADFADVEKLYGWFVGAELLWPLL